MYDLITTCTRPHLFDMEGWFPERPRPLHHFGVLSSPIGRYIKGNISAGLQAWAGDSVPISRGGRCFRVPEEVTSKFVTMGRGCILAAGCMPNKGGPQRRRVEQVSAASAPTCRHSRLTVETVSALYRIHDVRICEWTSSGHIGASASDKCKCIVPDIGMKDINTPSFRLRPYLKAIKNSAPTSPLTTKVTSCWRLRYTPFFTTFYLCSSLFHFCSRPTKC